MALFLLLIILGIAATLLVTGEANPGGKVVIKTGGEIYGTYDLRKNRTIKVRFQGHQNNVTIKDGKVSMTFSDCRNQNCVHQGAISNTSQAIICLPNQVVVEIVRERRDDIDVISN
ncbi:MAG: NusG domain II-containing protein [Clostridiales bacterium]|nr:NusG domain II-containing protein [Clostridiales bacterium]MDD7348081.1 NusG domain II-containing protein [Clostridiales bacterium]MDY4060431.1 NusG domain II-containing protein [Anaerovoracaceae bacterium]